MVLLALLPILFLIVALGFLKMAGWKACPIAAIIAFVIAVFALDFLDVIVAFLVSDLDFRAFP